MLTVAFTVRLAGIGITVNVCHPGAKVEHREMRFVGASPGNNIL
jgi:NAD(P)-dependent dehydrogenase (short-subunit alcohol dehydrogenase family)